MDDANGHVVEAVLREGKDLVGRAVVKVIEEDTAKTARLAAVGDLKVEVSKLVSK